MAGRILLVDDDPEMRELFGDVLHLDAHEVLAVGSLDEAVMPGDATPPDVILADAGMAQDGDIQALGAALAERFPTSELVYLADASNRSVTRRLERARLRYFRRPFQIEELRDLVNNLLQRRAVTGR